MKELSHYLRIPALAGEFACAIVGYLDARRAATRQRAKRGIQQRPTGNIPLLRVFQESYELMACNAFLVTAPSQEPEPPLLIKTAVSQGSWQHLHPTSATCILRNISDSLFLLVTVVTLVTPVNKAKRINDLQAHRRHAACWLQLVTLVMPVGPSGRLV